MNIVLLKPEDWIDEQRVLLKDQRATHIRKVLRASAGDTLRVGRLGGACGQGLIESIDAHGVVLSTVLTEGPPQRHPFDLVLALPRPKMLRRILRQCAEFGISHLHLINSARVEKSYWQSPLLQARKVEDALLAGMERARDTVAPQVHLHPRFRPFIEDELPGLAGERPCLITDMAAQQPLGAFAGTPALVMVGPEGGFVPFELELAQANGARPVHLGERTLSVDTALSATLAQGSAVFALRPG